ncbi:hypothetical protein K438DRAFT_1596465, partial [Mycena galopus ATCC 62051]
IQTTSVPSEQVFSSSTQTDTKRRNRLSPLLMEALQMLKFNFKKSRVNFMSNGRQLRFRMAMKIGSNSKTLFWRFSGYYRDWTWLSPTPFGICRSCIKSIPAIGSKVIIFVPQTFTDQRGSSYELPEITTPNGVMYNQNKIKNKNKKRILPYGGQYFYAGG